MGRTKGKKIRLIGPCRRNPGSGKCRKLIRNGNCPDVMCVGRTQPGRRLKVPVPDTGRPRAIPGQHGNIILRKGVTPTADAGASAPIAIDDPRR